MSKPYVIVYEPPTTVDGDTRPMYFKSLPLGMFWECTHVPAEAKRMTRAVASALLRETGKMQQGWRAVPEPIVAEETKEPV
jgi:hypothetical protein